MSRRRRAPDPGQLSLFEAPVCATRVPMSGAAAGAACDEQEAWAPAAAGFGASEREPEPPPLATARTPVPAPTPAPTPAPDAGSVANLLAPAVFRHPHADREILLHDHVVAYALKRVRRRSIGFMVAADGLSVNAPKWIALADIESALHEKSKWIIKKLGEQRERSERLAAARVDWRDGTTIPFLGEPMRVLVELRRAARGKTPAELMIDGAPTAGLPRLTLRVGLAEADSESALRDVVQAWLKRQARRIFEERCQLFAQRIGVRHTRLGLSSANTRWGSASADGSIRINWRLVHLGMPLIDYVVAHELAHLREMNHSPRFWAVVRSVLPDYEAARAGLKAGSVPMFD
jgi:predicted metal-dependent hydrolase